MRTSGRDLLAEHDDVQVSAGVFGLVPVLTHSGRGVSADSELPGQIAHCPDSFGLLGDTNYDTWSGAHQRRYQASDDAARWIEVLPLRTVVALREP